MTSQMKRTGIILIAVVLAVGLSLLGLGLSGVLFKGGETIQTGTGGTEAAAIVPTEGGETSTFPIVGPEAVTTEDIALIAQGEPVAASLETPPESLDFFVGQAVPVEGALDLSTPIEFPSLTPEVLDLIAFGNETVPPLAVLEPIPNPIVLGPVLVAGPGGAISADTRFTPALPLEVAISDDQSALDAQVYGSETEMIGLGGTVHLMTSWTTGGDFYADEPEYFIIVSPDQVLSPDNAALLANEMQIITIPYGDKVIVIPFVQWYGESAADFSY